MRILLIEDDPILTDVLVNALTSQHYAVDVAMDGLTGWDYAQSTDYDLILLDVELPKLDGVSLCQRLRAEKCTVPILLITARDTSSDRVRGLDAGADDYLIKPFDLAELQARIRALLRRGQVTSEAVLRVGKLRLDPRSCQVTYEDTALELRPKEYSLLEVFLRNPARVFSRAQLVEHLWTFDDPPQEDSVKAHVKGLRQKLKAVGIADWIENVYGLGYRLKEGAGEVTPEEESRSNSSHPSPVSDSSHAKQQMQQGLEKLWQQSQRLMAERLGVIHQAMAEIAAGNLPTPLRQDARQAAHKLAGVLGMFDRPRGTEVARQIEELFLGNTPLEQADQGERIGLLVQELDQLLEVRSSSEAGLPTGASPLAQTQPLLEQKPPTQSNSTTVLVVDDDPVFLAALRPMLEPWGIQMVGLDTPLRFWDVLQSTAPDLLILDVNMPDTNGIELCQVVREDPEWQGLPIIFLTAHCERETVQQVYAAGADDYITKPVLAQELLTRITNRLDRARQLQALATKDPLTGLVNQPQSSRVLGTLLHQATATHPVCLALLKVSQLPQINLQFGHATGNQVLQRWAYQLQSNLPGMLIAYWGNGEFVVGLSGFSRAEAEIRLAELLVALRQQVYSDPNGKTFQVAVHSGIAESPADGLTLQTLYQLCSARSQLSVIGLQSLEPM
jgi:diguanylate cyclase (GGDEF)-like protein